MRYHLGHAVLFTGGVTWSALLSITAVVTILINVGREFLGGRPEILDQVLEWSNDVVPGLFDDGSNGGLLDPMTFVVDSWWNPVTIVSAIVVLWAAVSVMTGLRRGIRAMFGLAGTPLPIHIGKLRDLVGFLGVGTAILLSAGVSTAVAFFGRPLLAWLGLSGSAMGTWLLIGTILWSFLLDALLFILLFRVTAGVHVVGKDMFQSAVLGATMTGALRQLGSSVVGFIHDPVLASFAAVATLAILVSLSVRVTLFVAAWAANPPRPPAWLPTSTFRHRQSPNYVTRSAPHTLAWPYHPVTGSLFPHDPETGELLMSEPEPEERSLAEDASDESL